MAFQAFFVLKILYLGSESSNSTAISECKGTDAEQWKCRYYESWQSVPGEHIHLHRNAGALKKNCASFCTVSWRFNGIIDGICHFASDELSPVSIVALAISPVHMKHRSQNRCSTGAKSIGACHANSFRLSPCRSTREDIRQTRFAAKCYDKSAVRRTYNMHGALHWPLMHRKCQFGIPTIPCTRQNRDVER